MGKYKIIIHVVHLKLQFQWENMFNFNGKQIFNFNGEHIFKTFLFIKTEQKKIRTVFSNLYLKFKKKSQITLQIYNENTYHVESLVVEFLK